MNKEPEPTANMKSKPYYTRRLTEEYIAVRCQLDFTNTELLQIFCGGSVEVLERVASGLSAMRPGHQDLPIIHSVIYEMNKSANRYKAVNGSGKGRKPVYSIPLEDTPAALLDVIKNSHHGKCIQLHLTFTLREILGAARRASIAETINRESLSAYRAELDMREICAKTVATNILHMKRLGRLFGIDDSTMAVIDTELRSSKLVASQEPSQLHAAFRANPVSPLDYARLARVASQEAYATKGSRQTVQRLFITAAALALLSFLPERISDILKLKVGKDVTRDARGWSSQFFSSKTHADRSFAYLPDQLTPYLDDLILLGGQPGLQGRDFVNLYRHRMTMQSPLFARIDLRRAYSPNRIGELVKERTGHGPHAARKAMTDYIAEIGGKPTDVLDLLGHIRTSTSETYYAVRADAIRRKDTLGVIDDLRVALADTGAFRLATGRLIDLDKIGRDLDRASYSGLERDSVKEG